jgi:hypothetical protein
MVAIKRTAYIIMLTNIKSTAFRCRNVCVPDDIKKSCIRTSTTSLIHTVLVQVKSKVNKKKKKKEKLVKERIIAVNV